MKKRIHKFLFVIFTFLFLMEFCPSKVNAYSITPSESSVYSSYDYVIDRYNIDMFVNENNTFDITETITVYFNKAKHGIYRTLPLKNKVTRMDGSTSKNRAQVTNVSVDHPYTTSKAFGNYTIKIGDKDKTITELQTYTIKYTYNIGKDPIKDYDELYYNLIGNDWDTVIGNLNFTITMPKNFDQSKLGFSSGKKGTIENQNISYYVDDNKIIGSYNEVLEVGEAVTVRCELEEGYFVGASLSINTFDLILFLLPVVFLLIAIFLWYKYGKDDSVVETVEFYPPENFNSLEIGFLYKGKAEQEDVTSLLIYLANQGYIKISETKSKSLFSKKANFKITKLKEYDKENLNEQLFFSGLFKNKDEVKAADLYNDFYITANRILANMNTKENKNKIFETSASSKKIVFILMLLIAYCLITTLPILAYSDLSILPFALLFPGIGFSVMLSMLSSKEKFLKIFAITWGSLFGGVPWLSIVFPTLLQDPIYLLGYSIGIICMIGIFICLKYSPKRTQYGNQILGKIKGFKTFLETAEKEQLEAMVLKNPSYFYNILPFTYVLGISDLWIKKFEVINIQAPNWYDSDSLFDIHSFGTFMNNTMTSAGSAMTSSPSSSSSGSSSGGGSSGGGSGGGGGGSW